MLSLSLSFAINGGMDDAVISALVTLYIFLGGAGSGALLVLGSIEGLRTLSRCPRRLMLLPRELLGRAWGICFLALALGIVCLSLDLGRFDRLLVLAVSPQMTPISIGAVSLAFALLLAGLGAACENFDRVALSIVTTRVFASAAIIVAAVAMSYTGVLLTEMASVVAWQTLLLPALFVLSSLSCGIALVIGAAAFVESRTSISGLLPGLLALDSAAIVAELGVLAAFVLRLNGDERTSTSFSALLFGDLAPLFWCLVIVCGLIVPLCIERFITDMSHHYMLEWTAVAILGGGLALRVCVIGLAQYDPVQELASMAYSSGLLVAMI